MGDEVEEADVPDPDLVVVGVPVLVLLVLLCWKLAHVRRVVLLVWMTIEPLPKKYGELGSVERYAST